MVVLHKPRTHTDHRVVLGVFREYGVTSHCSYFKGRTIWPILEDKGRTRQIEGYFHFNALKIKIKRPPSKYSSNSEPWISDTTWKLADQRM